MNKKKITLESLANKLSLSESTISRVLNGKGDKFRISKTTQQLINEEASKLNYSPNPMARGLRMNKTMIIGVIIPDIANPFFSSVAKIVEDITRKTGYSIILCDSLENEEIEQHSLKIMQSRNVDGILIAPVGLSANQIKKIQDDGIPIVVIDRYFRNSDLPYIGSDNYQGAYDAVEYIIKNGHKRIAIIKGIDGTVPSDERVRGYREAIENNGLQFDESLVVGDSFGEQNGYLETKLLLQHEKPPSAIFASSNLISLGVLRAYADVGLSVPDEMSIVAFDEQPYSRFLKTPMTTVEQNKKEIGYAAMKLLFQQMENKQILRSQSLILPTTLIKRDSVKNIIKNGNGR